MFFRKFFFLSLFLLCLVFFPNRVFASTVTLPVVTVINPIREPEKGPYPLDGLQTQYEIVKDHHISATWLWQYTTLEDNKLTDVAKSMTNQEFGLWMEIDRNLAAKAHVVYRGQGPWYFSDGLLLISYDTSEREKLINTAFARFRETFGYYPKTVGAWWIGEDSLNYMKEKYGILGTLRAADQFNLDVYSIWGTPWSIPYISSKTNEGIPGLSWQDSSQIVVMQWAPRDPTDGYGELSSTYSTQDYFLHGLNLSYFDYLSGVYLQHPLDQVVFGLEGGFTWAGYQGMYTDEIAHVATLRNEGKIAILPAQTYEEAVLAKQQIFPGQSYFLNTGFNSSDQSFWYQSPQYRAGIEKQGDNIYLVDVRNYSQNPQEDFAQLPNSQGYLRITEPALLDSVRFPGQKKLLATSSDPLRVQSSGTNVMLFAGDKKIATFSSAAFDSFSFQPQGYTFSLWWALLVLFLLYGGVIVLQTKSSQKTRMHLAMLFVPLLFAFPFLTSGNSTEFSLIFDKKEFFLFFIAYLHVLPLTFHVLLVFQIMPFIMLLAAHFFLFLRSSKKIYRLLYFVVFGLITLLYLHVPYFPLDRSTYKTVFIVFGICAVLCLIGIGFIFLKTKSVKWIAISLMASLLLFLFLGVTVLFSRQQFILTPFETEALTFISARHERVFSITSQGTPIYKAVKPVLYDFPKAGALLTNVSWQKITSVKGHINLSSEGLVFVPRYLGADISEEDIAKYKLIKVFDNAQIAIYEKKSL
ncbi:MAG: hypothetical protein KGJ07_03745 [Patescibacteria group bacterium]|nr:hypothetical protein [Patescibacteria group bacterium]